MASTLHIGDGKRGPLRLPLDIAVQTIAVLAQKGKGKTYAASVLAEEMEVLYGAKRAYRIENTRVTRELRR